MESLEHAYIYTVYTLFLRVNVNSAGHQNVVFLILNLCIYIKNILGDRFVFGLLDLAEDGLTELRMPTRKDL